jgi:hypothetical protein
MLVHVELTGGTGQRGSRSASLAGVARTEAVELLDSIHVPYTGACTWKRWTRARRGNQPCPPKPPPCPPPKPPCPSLYRG